MSKFRVTLVSWIAVICLVGAPTYARAEGDKEYLVKAAFIYNFVKFVEWPEAKAIGNQSRIDICILGDTLLSAASNVFTAASTPKLTLSLVHDSSLRNIPTHCHVVFIGQSESDRLPDILAALAGHPVLTVSDMDGFVQSGGMIGFVTDENKIKIAVNKRAITSSGMRVDAQLLEIAHEVIDK